MTTIHTSTGGYSTAGWSHGRGVAIDPAVDYAVERLQSDWAEGSWTPCPSCTLTVEAGELLDVDPCDEDIERMFEQLDDEAEDELIERAADQAAFESYYY